VNFIDVWITFPNGETAHCGEIAYPDPDKRSRTEPGSVFRYTSDYLSHPKAFALAPNQLPLTNDEFICEGKIEDISGVFEDSLPDQWGRKLLSKRHNITVSRYRLASLLPYLQRDGIGALSYQPKGSANANRPAKITELERLVQVANELEQGLQSNDQDLALLFGAGSSPGGARPKALINDANQYWLAKFPSMNDQLPMVRLECATLDLAVDAGLNIPEHRVETCGRFEVLLIERFDINPQGGRNHLLSMSTLLNDLNFYRYSDMAEIIREYSNYPKDDLEHMFRHMVFNALIGNTDDHEKNVSMMHSDNGWTLTPAYDLLPNYNANPEHATAFNGNGWPPTHEALIALGKGPFSLSDKKAHTTLSEVLASIVKWRKVFRSYQLSDKNINFFKKDIEYRLSLK